MRKKETPNPSRVRGRGVEVSETLFYGNDGDGGDDVRKIQKKEFYRRQLPLLMKKD